MLKAKKMHQSKTVRNSIYSIVMVLVTILFVVAKQFGVDIDGSPDQITEIVVAIIAATSSIIASIRAIIGRIEAHERIE